MKACGYCGRENDDALTQCGGCGSNLPALKTSRSDSSLHEGTFEAEWVNLAQVPGAFAVSEGFSRPDWNVITATVEATADHAARAVAWELAVRDWVRLLASELGGSYAVRTSPHAFLLSALPFEAADKLLKFIAQAMEKIALVLGDAGTRGSSAPTLVLLFEEQDDYLQYISNFYPDGNHPASRGAFLEKGYPHIALHDGNGFSRRRTISHELTHHALTTLSIPRWVHEAVAMTIEGLVTRSPREVLPGDQAIRHHLYWTNQNIQGFWAGTSFCEPGESFELSYSLASVLMHLLGDKDRESVLAFIRAANVLDGGQTAALDHLGLSLGELAAKFLGPGDWRPKRREIARCWETANAEHTANSADDTTPEKRA